MKLMTFDVGGTEIKYSVMDESFRMENSGSVPTPRTTLDALVGTMADIYMAHKEQVEGVAVSLPGFIDAKDGVVRGVHGTAGEFSFVNTNSQGWPDPRNYVASQCSTPGLLEIYREKKGSSKELLLDGRKFFAGVLAGDPAAMEALESFARAVAVQAYNLTVLLDIEKLAVGGGVSRQPILTGKIREAYDTLMAEYPVPQMIQALPRPEIVTCHFGGKANQVGAFLSYLNALKD